MVTDAPEDILLRRHLYGPKAVRLAQLIQDGVSVPHLRGLSSEALALIMSPNNADTLRALVQELAGFFPKARFAVRSAGKSEDETAQSRAGFFSTLLDVPLESVPEAIKGVVEDAVKKGTPLSEFAIILQEFVPADYAGVLFTRNPLGSRESVVEWRKGKGIDVVGGKKVERLVYVPGHTTVEPFKGFTALSRIAESIETRFASAQDIEWVVVGGRVFIVQARPLTTISKAIYEGFIRAESVLPRGDYYLDQASLAEAFVHPTPLAWSIFEMLHHPDGAIARAYKRIGIHIPAAGIHVKVGSYVYIDKEKELHQFYPSHTYFGRKALVPHWKTLRGIGTTLSNMQKLSAMPLPDVAELRLELRTLMKESIDKKFATTQEAKAFFTRVYTEVFLANIYAQKTFMQLDVRARRLKTSALSLMTLPAEPVPPYDVVVREALMRADGNSLDIADETPFVGKDTRSHGAFAESGWWDALPEGTQNTLRPLIKKVQAYETLREEGRVLTVLALQSLRAHVHEACAKKGIGRELMYFATITEIEAGSLAAPVLTVRKRTFDEEKSWQLPKTMASVVVTERSLVYGVSPGKAEGRVVEPGGTITKDSIVLAERLSPDLAQYLGTVAGIVAREGGILSHLAIVAREYHTPVVVDTRTNSPVIPGKNVRIDGTKGTVEIVS